MNKLKELLFLKNIKGLGKVKINKNYLSLLNELSDLDDLIATMEYEYNIPLDNLEQAKQKAETKYENIINDSDITVITVFDDNYPKQLHLMKNKKPLILYVKGNVEALSKENIAFIGTRKPSKISEEFEKQTIKSILKDNDRIIVSGLALGCDKIAHQATVDEKKITIAVLPSGVNLITPASNKKLASQILENNGCLISEYEPDARAFKGNYLERDNIVAALSDAIFVVECGIKSGTMHTVNFSRKYNTPLFTYLPNERPYESFGGNEFILNEFDDSIKVEYIEEFLNELEILNKYHEDIKSSKGNVQSKLM